MTELKYLESKGIKDNPRIIDSSGQATDFYLQDLLEDYTKQLALTDVVDSKRFTETDLLNGYQAGCIEGLDDCCDLGLDDLKEIKEDAEKWVKRYTE